MCVADVPFTGAQISASGLRKTHGGKKILKDGWNLEMQTLKIFPHLLSSWFGVGGEPQRSWSLPLASLLSWVFSPSAWGGHSSPPAEGTQVRQEHRAEVVPWECNSHLFVESVTTEWKPVAFKSDSKTCNGFQKAGWLKVHRDPRQRGSREWV